MCGSEDEVICRYSVNQDGYHPVENEGNEELLNRRPLYKYIQDYCVVQV